MTNLWVTFSTDSSGSFIELSGNIIYNLNELYNFSDKVIDVSSDFIIYELSNNNPIQGNVSLQANNWKQLNLNTILNPFQGYWLGGINTTVQVYNKEYIFENYDYNNDNLGVVWSFEGAAYSNGTPLYIPSVNNPDDGVYFGVLSVDVNSSTNYEYNIKLTITNQNNTGSYKLVLEWNGITTTIENLLI